MGMAHTADTNTLTHLIRNYTIDNAKADGYVLGASATIGDAAIVHAMGQMRRGVVVKIGRKNIHVAYTTRNAVDEAARYGGDVRTYVKAAPMGEVWIAATDTPAPAATTPATDLIDLIKNFSIHQALTDGFVLGAPAQIGDTALINAVIYGLNQLRRGKVVSVDGDDIRVAYATRAIVDSPTGYSTETKVHTASAPRDQVWIKPSDTSKVADAIVDAFAQVKIRRLSAEEDAVWSDSDSHARYIGMIGTARCWRINSRAVCASVVSTDIPGWGHAVAEMLDQACDTADVAGVTHATGVITELAPNLYRLTW